MASPEITLEEQLSDQRSNQIAYKISITASRDSRFRLVELQPRIPHGSRLVEIIDTSMAEIKTRRNELIEDLNSIVKNVIWTTSESHRAEWIALQKSSIKEAMTFSGLFRLYMEMMIPFWTSDGSMLRRAEREFRRMTYSVNSVEDARTANSLWIKKLTKDDNRRAIFSAKIGQLQQIENKVGKIEDTGLADIDSSSPFSATYVVHFKRGLLESRKYQIGFDIDYVEMPKAAGFTNTRTANIYSTVKISPSPFALSIVAIIAALMGTTVKLLLSVESNIFAVPAMLNSAQMLVGPIVALIFFNIYEQTSVGRGMFLAVNWRSALLIGALCGLAYERILEALKALIGAQ